MRGRSASCSSLLAGAVLASLLAGCSSPPPTVTSDSGRVGATKTPTPQPKTKPEARASPLTTAIGNRREFTSGACIAWRPASSVRATVFLDPGHGGPDSGATTVLNGAPLDEKTLTLAVALAVKARLLHDGYRVVLARTGDESVVRLRPSYIDAGSYTALGDRMDLEARVDCANAARANVLLSIHFDSYDDPTVGGSETLYDDARPFRAANLRLASLLQESVVSALVAAGEPITDRGIVTDSAVGTPALTVQGASYAHLLELGPAAPGWLDRPSEMPGALVEPLFLSNPTEAAIAASVQGQQELARALATGIERFLAHGNAARCRATCEGRR